MLTDEMSEQVVEGWDGQGLAPDVSSRGVSCGHCYLILPVLTLDGLITWDH